MVNKSYRLQFPEELVLSLKMSEGEFAEEIKRLALVKLFELGKISSGKAAASLDLSRVEFLNLLQRYKVSIFYDSGPGSLKQDIENA